MQRYRLCPRCGCSHGTQPAAPYTATMLCALCLAVIASGPATTTPQPPPHKPKAPTKRKRGTQ